MGQTAWTLKLDFEAATSTATNGRLHISEGLQASSGKEKFQPDNGNGCEKYSDSNEDEWFLGFDKKGNNVYMKHCKVLIELIAESKDKEKGTRTYKKVVNMESEEERDPEVEMMVKRRWKRKVNKLVIRCFYQSDPTIRGY